MSVGNVRPGLLRVTAPWAALVATVGGQPLVGTPRPAFEAPPFISVSLPAVAAAILRLLVREGRRLAHKVTWRRRELFHRNRNGADHEGEALDVVVEGGTCFLRGLRVGQNGALRRQIRLRIATNEPFLMIIASGFNTPVRLHPLKAPHALPLLRVSPHQQHRGPMDPLGASRTHGMLVKGPFHAEAISIYIYRRGP